MARIDTLEHFLDDIASAIKTKLDDNSTIYPNEFDTLILSIDNLNLQSKTVTPTTSQQTITPDEEYNALTQVTVNAVDYTIDNNIKSINIRDGVNILGVIGNYTGDGRKIYIN